MKEREENKVENEGKEMEKSVRWKRMRRREESKEEGGKGRREGRKGRG